MNVALAVLFLSVSIGGGAGLIYGTWRNWPSLVDPDEKVALVSSLSFVRKVFGARALRVHNYVLGSALILIGLVMLGSEYFKE